jgi:glutamate-ammonia-ligase adenylyltransferase
MPEFESVLIAVPESLRSAVVNHWQDYCAAATHAGLSLPAGRILAQLVRVWACSDFVARACVRDPPLLTGLFESGELERPRHPGDIANHLQQALADVANEDRLNGALRRWRRREMVRIAWRDLAGVADLAETLAELSELAEVAVAGTLDRLYVWHTDRFGMPRDTQGQPQQLVVLGMGKLGGGELNFSSDIDLIFAFPAAGQTDGRRSIANEEFFRRLGQALIKALNEITADGFVFRVDMRLRPFGESGPLVMPFSAFEDYYQAHGRDWERYAMIKAHVIAGDRAAGEQLLAHLRPFVYRRYLDYGAIEALREMKALIAKEVQRKGLQRNIKLGPGGIREIEFIAQVFQLIYGGRHSALRDRRLLPVLDQLAAAGHLPADSVTGLKTAYIFLRRIENRLQAWADQQTYNLPEEVTAQRRLAYSMNFPDWDAFAAELAAHVQQVNEQFAAVFATAATPEKLPGGVDFTTLWRGTLAPEGAERYLAEQGFDDPAQVQQRLVELKRGLPYRSLSQRGRERMDRLMPLVLREATATTTPTVTLERLIQLIETIARRSVYLALLADHRYALRQLVRLCAASPWIARHLARYPLLLDELLNPADLYHPPERATLAPELERQLQQVPAGDIEQRLDALRHFKHAQVLRVAAADISGALPLMIVSDHLTEIAEVLLRQVLELAQADLLDRYGRPRCREHGETREAGFTIVAYGKLGGIELNYGSDLDLVFLHDSDGDEQISDGPHPLDNPTYFARLVQRIIYWLTTRTAAGELYEVDMRLRPSGRAGLLVSSLAAFAEYQRHQAWTWEHQALVRARVVAGPPDLADRFAGIRCEVLSRPRDPAELRREVREMRGRMRTELGSTEVGRFHLKQDAGGIADIEFMVQYAVLANAHRYPELLTYSDNIRQLDGLECCGLLGGAEATLLRDAYRALRRRLHHLTLQEQPGLIGSDELQDYREGVVRLWRRLMESD